MSEYPWYIWAAFFGLLAGVAIPIILAIVSGDWRWLLITAASCIVLWLWLVRWS